MTHYKIPSIKTTANIHKYKCLDCARLMPTEELEKFVTAVEAVTDVSKRVRLHHNHEHHQGCCIHLVSSILEDYEIVAHRSKANKLE